MSTFLLKIVEFISTCVIIHNMGGDFMDIGSRIKHKREELNMTQEELALKVGYKSKSSINKIEIGNKLNK